MTDRNPGLCTDGSTHNDGWQASQARLAVNKEPDHGWLTLSIYSLQQLRHTRSSNAVAGQSAAG